ncbi:hypothetical protein BVRB_038500 [Beta vulgaris subsp. vulgaris]|uniref:Uncharacterized protein n=1 Tax=Beta vulgaris subsp. vulgaris TaxID=3555 RepID=A0A0J8BHJ2_BETVV|nr:hypothetical protein BVRB_038500 [Beta vulgaris subsp. vulgaris]
MEARITQRQLGRTVKQRSIQACIEVSLSQAAILAIHFAKDMEAGQGMRLDHHGEADGAFQLLIESLDSSIKAMVLHNDVYGNVVIQ